MSAAARERRVSTNHQDFAALDLAARLAAEYRRDIAAAETVPVAGYSEIHARF